MLYRLRAQDIPAFAPLMPWSTVVLVLHLRARTALCISQDFGASQVSAIPEQRGLLSMHYVALKVRLFTLWPAIVLTTGVATEVLGPDGYAGVFSLGPCISTTLL